jgi:hypothetical protein
MQIERRVVEIRFRERDRALERELRGVLDRQVQRERKITVAADREILSVL